MNDHPLTLSALALAATGLILPRADGVEHTNQDLGTGFSHLAAEASGESATSVPLPCAMDLDANGSVDFIDLVAVLEAWGPCPDPSGPIKEDGAALHCLGDIDGSGSVGFGDLLSVINNIGRQCVVDPD